MKNENDKKIKIREASEWIFVIMACVFGMCLFGGGLYYLLLDPQSWLIRIIRDQFAAIILPPLMMVSAMVVVISLKISGGPVKFKILGFDFEGTSSQVIMWVLVYLVFVFSVKLLWIGTLGVPII